MILTKDKSNCCGCSACMQICPVHAITMKEDKYGFLYPILDEASCVHCNLCNRVCLFRADRKTISEKKTWVAVASGDNTESSSGGVFASIAQRFIDEGGVVCGSSLYKENGMLQVKHVAVQKVVDINTLKGSKYVQSDTREIYRDVKRFLEEGRKVLFSGTPCQIIGLHGYLQKNYDELYCIDIVCHGVPNIHFFHDYVSYFEKQHKLRIDDYCFRDKSEGWKLHGRIKGINESGKREVQFFTPEESSYYQMFLDGFTYRESCYSCPYASDARPGDITLGDYWCVDLVHPEYMVENGGEIDDQNGVSSLIINNAKGRQLIELYGQRIDRWESSYEKASKYNAQLRVSSKRKPERDIILSLYSEGGYSLVEKWYQKRLKKKRLKRNLKAMVPKRVKCIIRKTLE